MKVTTKQVDAAEALRAVIDGKQVQMIWMRGGEPIFYDLTGMIQSKLDMAETYLVYEIEEESAEEPAEDIQPEPVEDVPETVVTDPDTTPVTVEIPNSKKAEKERWRKVDDEMIIKLRKDGLSEMKIALELDTTQPTVHSHIQKLKKEGRL